NNIAICVSGDFDPDTFVATIEKYFGDWEPNPDIKTLQYEEEAPITAPVEKNVYGLDAEFVMVGWRTPGEKDFLRSEVGDLVSSILSNGKAGIADLDLIQAQKVNSFFGFNYARPDYGEFLLFGYPRAGQSLEQVRDLMLEEIAKLRAGDFDDELIQATINNYKLSKMRQLERNGNRAMAFVNSFINEHNWKDDALQMKRLEKVTKQQIVDWANEYLGANSHVTAYKRLGVDKNIDKIAAPAITPIETNRDKQSAFLKDIQQTEVKPIDPVFLDFSKDMKKGEISGLEFLYKKNELNDIATLFCTFDKGTQNDPRLDIAFRYLDYLGTPDRSAEQIKKELYNLACNERYSAGPLQSNIGVTGLDENVGKAMAIVEDLIFNAVADTNILAEVKSDILKNRADEKLSQSGCFSALQRYIFYGPEFIGKNTLTNEQVLALTSDELLQAVRDLYGKKHDILYYGPSDEGAARKIIADCHKVSDNPEALEKEIPQDRRVEKSEVFIAPYDANQFYYLQYSNDGNKFDVSNDPSVTMYNNYFGSGMNAIVFQEMREARGLAYSARAFLRTPSFKESDYSFYAFIASQNDKLREAVEAFDKIINDMPESPEAFEVAKTAVLNNLRTNRTTGISVLYDYLDLKDLGLTEDRDKAVFEKIQNMTLEDVKAFQQKWIKDRKYVYGLLGRESDFDMDFVRSLGPVTELTLEEIFGY
ncbi:MAG: insulinase family protein, partial [Bacteroidales bacterium]|nr:insulinase family protein [Bacteroidales bacterium]